MIWIQAALRRLDYPRLGEPYAVMAGGNITSTLTLDYSRLGEPFVAPQVADYIYTKTFLGDGFYV